MLKIVELYWSRLVCEGGGKLCCWLFRRCDGSETWAAKVEDVRRLVRTERAMVRWMCGVTLKDRKSSDELLGRLGVEDVVEVVRRGRLLWFGHVERKSQDDWVKMCRDLVVEGTRRKGRRRKTWQECVNEDMKRMGLS